LDLNERVLTTVIDNVEPVSTQAHPLQSPSSTAEWHFTYGLRLAMTGRKGANRPTVSGTEKAANYNPVMARGWESKSVEAQQAEAQDKSTHSPKRLSPEQAAVARKKESLRLARQRVLEQLEQIRDPRHRQQLENALAELDGKLSLLGN
jgi:hypothetical protein